jgi:hypothetical protein
MRNMLCLMGLHKWILNYFDGPLYSCERCLVDKESE